MSEVTRWLTIGTAGVFTGTGLAEVVTGRPVWGVMLLVGAALLLRWVGSEYGSSRSRR